MNARPDSPAIILRTQIADENHVVVTVESQTDKQQRGYRLKPCPNCPWRTDQPVGRFPAEAFRISAHTAHDMSRHSFGCHMSGPTHPETCAGFLLRSADHNLGVRLDLIHGRINLGKVSSDTPLYDSYRSMAEANGVDPEDPALSPCR